MITRMEIREDCTGEKCIRQLRVTRVLCDTWVSTYHMTNLYEATHIDREENATFKRDVPFRSAVRCFMLVFLQIDTMTMHMHYIHV